MERVIASLRLVVLVGLAGIGTTGLGGGEPAGAQPYDCSTIAGGGRTVFFGTPRLSGLVTGFPGDVGGLMDEVLFAFENERERRWVERAGEPVYFVSCAAQGLISQPAWIPQVPDLYDQMVLLEVRSVLRIDDGAATALLQYASVPTAFNFSRGRTDARGVYGVRFELPANGDYVLAFVRPLEIDTYVAAGLGIRYLDDSEFDLALSNLCQARRHLETLAQLHATDMTPSQTADLETFARFIDSQLADVVANGFGERTGTNVTLFAETRPEEFATDPCFADRPPG